MLGGDCDAFLLIKVFVLCLMLENWGNGFSSVNGVICFGSFCLTLGSLWSWFDSSCVV